MRRVLLLIALCCVAAGCGLGGEEEAARPVATVDDGVAAADAARPASSLAPPEPTPAALAARPDPELRARLDAGASALVDRVGRIGIRLRAIDFAKGGQLEDVEWSSWTDRSAEGRGRMVALVCDPTCAQGTLVEVPATITLSDPVACPDGRFFDRARISVAADEVAAEPTAWLAAPC
jgi:hypothetical protein